MTYSFNVPPSIKVIIELVDYMIVYYYCDCNNVPLQSHYAKWVKNARLVLAQRINYDWYCHVAVQFYVHY